MNKTEQVYKLRGMLDACFNIWTEMEALLEEDPALVDQLNSEQRERLLDWATRHWASYPQEWVERLKEIENFESDATNSGLKEMSL